MIKFLYYALASSILTVVIFFYQIAMSIGFGPEPNFLIILIIAAITVILWVIFLVKLITKVYKKELKFNSKELKKLLLHLLLVITILVALFFYLGLSGIRISF